MCSSDGRTFSSEPMAIILKWSFPPIKRTAKVIIAHRDLSKLQIINRMIVHAKITGYANPKNGIIFNVFGCTNGDK
jgi:hypothetical protein